jgi:CBS domain-containing protein
MTRDLVTVTPGMDVFDALLLMKDANVKHLPVVDDKRLVGFITVKDILRVQPHLFDNFVDSYRLREANRKPIKHAEMDED